MSVQSHFGKGVDTSIFTPKRQDSNGKNICCNNNSLKWFGLINNGNKTNPLDGSPYFCDFCASNYFKPTEIYELDEGLSLEYSCCTKNTLLCIDYGINRRCINMNGISVNINITHPTNDSDWAPTMYIPTEKGLSAAKSGVGLFPLPSMCYWEFVVKGTKNGKYYDDDYYFKVKSAKFGDGRNIIIKNKVNNTNIFYKTKDSLLIVNSYESGNPNSRFFYQAPSNLETENGIEADHNCESNKLYLDISIFKQEMDYEKKEPIYRGGSSYKGGSNFAATGESSTIKTKALDKNITQVDSVQFIIQLVNNEKEEELINLSSKIQTQVENKTQKDIEELLKERGIIDQKIKFLREKSSERFNLFQEHLLL